MKYFTYCLLLSEEMDVEARLTELCEEVKVFGFLKFTLPNYLNGFCFLFKYFIENKLLFFLSQMQR